ncbi:MAG: hypothetical protein HY807_04270 [Nitrospirae bacterium]|nr:hypothetical protein [Nitrospirota bacterium]
MKKHILLIIIRMIFLCVPGISMSFDKDGCLTCHQYPGLVRQEAGDNFKLLHIDEAKYASSPHGKVDCKDCHTGIKEIPHTNISSIDCITKCHLNEKEKIQGMVSSLNGFHKGEKHLITNIKSESSCTVCHKLYPHSKNKKIRAFLNMHTGYAVCEVCHLKKEKLQNLTYEWMNPEGAVFHGQPYGTYYNKDTGRTEENSGFISRIAVYHEENGEGRILFNKADIAKAKLFIKNEKAFSPEKKRKELDHFHKDIVKLEVSVACNECHSENSILDFKKLGFSATRVNDLKYLNIKSLVTKYDTFILPNLFGK